jgi:tetratricopeptide (TPR) repeat protein
MMTQRGAAGWLSATALFLFVSVQAAGQTSNDFVQRGLASKAQGKYDEAIADFTESIRLAPDNSSAFHDRGSCWFAKGQYDAAIADYNEAIRLDPNDAGTYGPRGTTWEAKGRFDLALADFNEDIRLDPGNSPAYDARGDYWKRQGFYDRALADYNAALAYEPYYAWGYLDRAWLLATCPDQHYRDGKRAFSDALMAYQWRNYTYRKLYYYRNRPGMTYYIERSAPGDCAALFTILSAAYAECGDFKKAIEYQQTALTRYEADKNRGVARALIKQYELSEPYRFKAPASSTPALSAEASLPIEVGARVVLKAAEAPLKVENNVVATGREPVVYRVDQVSGNWLWVVVGDRKGWVLKTAVVQVDQAAKYFTDQLRNDPEASWMYSRRAAVWRERHEYENAVADFTEAIRQDPDSASAYTGRAWVWAAAPDAKVRDGKRAIESATRACELTGWKDLDALGALAAAYAETGDFDSAVKYQEQGLGLLPKDDKDHPGDRARLTLFKEKKPYRE